MVLIVESWDGLGQKLQIISFQIPAMDRECVQVTPSSIQAGLGHFQEWCSHSSSGQSVPVS